MKKPHIILDLDETCISAVEVRSKTPAKAPNLKSFQLFYGGVLNFVVYKRPYLDEFLATCFKLANVSFWSAGEKQYVIDIVSNIVDPAHYKDIRLILWRDHCLQSNKNTSTLKSIQWLAEKIPNMPELLGTDMVLLDDLADNTIFNGIYGFNVPAFNSSDEDASQDTTLLRLAETLKQY